MEVTIKSLLQMKETKEAQDGHRMEKELLFFHLLKIMKAQKSIYIGQTQNNILRYHNWKNHLETFNGLLMGNILHFLCL